MKDLTKGKPLRVILFFAIPLYIGQLFQLFYSLVDTRIIGQALGDGALGAVGATIPLSDLLIGFISGVISGFGIIIASYFGAKDKKNLSKAIGETIVLSVVATVLISVLCIILLPYILRFMNVSDKLRTDASDYIRIIIIGLVATTFYNICAAILRAIGDSLTPLIFLFISNVLNIGLDYLLVICFHKGVAGAAIATVASQAVSALLCFLYMQKKYHLIHFEKRYFAKDKLIYGKLLPTGLSMGFMMSFVMIGSLALQTSINTLGTNTIVAHTAARKLTMLFLIPFFVLGTALATYCGQNMGAKEYGRIKKGIRDTIGASMVWCVVAALIVYIFSPYLIKLITASDDVKMIDTATLYLKVNVLLYPVCAVICILRNSMQGFGDTKTPLISSMIELFGKVAIAYLLVPLIDYMGVIISEPVVWVLMVVPLIIRMKRTPINSEMT